MSTVIVSENLKEKIKDRYIIADTDFLDRLSKEEDLLSQIKELATNSPLVVHQYVRFEFIRDSHLPETIKNREAFLNSPFFLPLPSRTKPLQTEYYNLVEKMQNNALTISRIFAHKGVCKPSFVDLMLSGTCFLLTEKALIATGNRKDYPALIFDTLGTINYDNKNLTHSYTFWLLSPSVEKFNKCYEDLSKICKKTNSSPS